MNTPEHYQPILYLDPADVIGPLPYWLGAAVKYIWRAPLKNGGDDYMKAADCLRRYQQLHGFAPAPKLNLTPKTWHRARTLWEKTTILGCDRATNNFHVLTLNRVLGLVLGSDPSTRPATTIQPLSIPQAHTKNSSKLRYPPSSSIGPLWETPMTSSTMPAYGIPSENLKSGE